MPRYWATPILYLYQYHPTLRESGPNTSLLILEQKHGGSHPPPESGAVTHLLITRWVLSFSYPVVSVSQCRDCKDLLGVT